jgi:peptidoglycan/LPS O-acetylase OafA/YrhL
MGKKLSILMGLSIVAVVSSHAAGWGYTAMIWWAHRYLSVTIPYYGQVESFKYYVLLIIKQLTVFSVPGILFVSGYFIAFAAKGIAANANWNFVKTRITRILYPYIIWSIVIFVIIALKGDIFSPVEYIKMLLTGTATQAYYFIPIICQFYLISPLLIPLAKYYWRLFLIFSLLIQLIMIILFYINIYLFDNEFFIIHIVFLTYLIYFSFGMVVGFHWEIIRPILIRFKWLFLVFLLIMSFLTIVEGEIIRRTIGIEMLGSPTTITGSIYAIMFILCILTFIEVIPLLSPFSRLSKSIFGIYLIHPIVLELVSVFVYWITPKVLMYQIVFVLILIISGIMIPKLLMNLVSKYTTRKYYSLLFG